jgi:exo-beta-1,3-glucanase (GH17 family)
MPKASLFNRTGCPVWAAWVLLCGFLTVLVWWVARGVTIDLPSVESPATQAIPCLSYSPFRQQDVNPFNYLAKVSPAQIEADLTLLKTRTRCVRTYGLAQGLDAVPDVAKKLGLRVRLGIWLVRDTAHNQAQLSLGLELAKSYPDVVELLIVGNEVLLRNELTVAQLGLLLEQAKAKATVPITYADVWEFWLRHPELATKVDWVTVHILPYWENQPVAFHHAAQHVMDVARTMQQNFSGKKIWIGETGWPAAGRQRAGAVPSKVGQTAFLRDLLMLRPAIAQDFNFIEAFDQPWKRSFEGAMGGYWGLFDAQGKARVSFSGPVVEDPLWWHGLLGAALGALLGCLLLGRVDASWQSRAMFIGCFGGALVGAVCAVQWLMMAWWDRSAREFAVSIGLGLLGASSAFLSLHQWASVSEVSGPHVTDLVAMTTRTDRWADALRKGVLFCAACAALVLLLDPRYRPFPWWWFLAPTVCWLALELRAPGRCSPGQLQTRFLASVLALAALGIVLQEGWQNAQALSYGTLLLCLAAVAIWSSFTSTRPASNAAGALSSAQ